jgi:hypothetical protein
MARPLRIEYPGALYHFTSRGDRREEISPGQANGEGFCDQAMSAPKTSWFATRHVRHAYSRGKIGPVTGLHYFAAGRHRGSAS